MNKCAGSSPETLERKRVNETRSEVTQGNTIPLKLKREKTERGDGREMNL